MNRLASSLVTHFVLIAALACPIVFVAGQGHSQPPAARIGTVQETLNITKDMDKEGRDALKQFDAMQRGERPVSTDEDKAILEDAAKWYIYRLTLPVHQEPGASRTMHELVKQAESKIVDPRDPRKQPNENQRTFKEEFDRRMAARLAEVMRNPKPIARLNAAMILAHLAKTGQEEAIDILIETVQDPQENDGVKLWAFRGLKDFFDFGQGDSPFRKKDREARCIQALLEYVQRKPASKQPLTPSEAKALSYVRAEAVAALGLSRYPAFSTTVKKKTIIERTTALTLLRIIRKDGIVPEPGLTEQVHAVVGLCQLQSRLCDEYQMDYAAYHVGRFIAEFVHQRNAGRNSMMEPWKIHAARLHQALEELKTQAEPTSARAYVANFVSQAQAPLNSIVLNPNSQPDPTKLNTWLDTNPPVNKALYKGLVDAVVKEAEKPAEQ